MSPLCKLSFYNFIFSTSLLHLSHRELSGHPPLRHELGVLVFDPCIVGPSLWCLQLILILGLSYLITSVNGVYFIYAFSSEMDEIQYNGLGVPILFPVDEDGLATVTALHISIRFGLQDTSLWVEREVYDPHTSALLHTVPEVSKHSDDGSIIWTLKPSRYRCTT